MTSILIVDDHVLIRENVRSLLSRNPIMHVCGEAQDGMDALEKAKEYQPEIVLIDIEMPRMNGIEAAREIHRLLPSTKIVFFTIHPLSLFDDSTSWSHGFVSKLATETHLIPTLNHLVQTVPEGLSGPLRYQWQHSIWDAFASSRDSLSLKIEIARRAIATRLTDVRTPNHDERIALNEALQALAQLMSETMPS